jgi:hypothetical protein
MALCNLVKAKRGQTKKTKKKQNKSSCAKKNKLFLEQDDFVLFTAKSSLEVKKETFKMISNSSNLDTSSPRQLHRFETKHSVDLKRMPKNLRNNTFTDVGHLSTSSTLLFYTKYKEIEGGRFFPQKNRDYI